MVQLEVSLDEGSLGLHVGLVRRVEIMSVVCCVSLGFWLHPRTGVYQVKGVSPRHWVDCSKVRACALDALFLLPVRDLRHRGGRLGLPDLKHRPEVFAFPLRQDLLFHDSVCFLDANCRIAAGAIGSLPRWLRHQLLEVRSTLCAI